MLPKISIITPSFNQAEFLEETILSIINQNYPNLEIIIIDGGSTDNSIQIIKKYEEFIDFWVSEKDNGQTHAINKGFKKATGDIITWLCSDDTYLSEALHTVGKFFTDNPKAEFVFGNTKAVNENGEILKEIKCLPFNILSFLARVNTIPQPASFYRRSILEKVGYLDETLYLGMDYDFFARIFLQKVKIYHINNFLATYRYHSNSKTVIGLSNDNQHHTILGGLAKKYTKIIGFRPLTIRICKVFYRLIKRIYNLKHYLKNRKTYK